MAIASPFSSVFCEENNLSASGTRAGRQTACQFFGLSQCFLAEHRVQQFIELLWFATLDGSLFVNHALVQEVHGNFNHSGTSSLTVTCLQEPEFTFLDCKLHILHVVVVFFKACLNCIKLLVDFRHSLFH